MGPPLQYQVFPLQPGIFLQQLLALLHMGLAPVTQARGQVGYPVYRGGGSRQHRARCLQGVEMQVCGNQTHHRQRHQQYAPPEVGLFDK